AIWSGGSLVSWSVTSAATIVTVQVSPPAKSVAGSSVNVVGPPLTVAVCGPLVPHEIVYQPSATSTGSLNVIATFEPDATPVAAFAGVVAVTAGAWSAEAITLNAISAAPERAWASLIVAGRTFGPVGVAAATLVAKVKRLSPGVTSPCVPSS